MTDATWTWQMAEKLAAHHMVGLGFEDAKVTPGGADAGIDVRASDAAAQVKNYAVPVGRPDIQRFLGASRTVPNQLFYSLSGYSTAAVLEADDANVALFRFTAKGDVESLNARARELTNSPRAKTAERQRQLNEHVKDNPVPGGYDESRRDRAAVLLRLLAMDESKGELSELVEDGPESVARRELAVDSTQQLFRRFRALRDAEQVLPRYWDQELAAISHLRNLAAAAESRWVAAVGSAEKVAAIVDARSRTIRDENPQHTQWRRKKFLIGPVAREESDEQWKELELRARIVNERARALHAVLRDLHGFNAKREYWPAILEAHIETLRGALVHLQRMNNSLPPYHYREWARDVKKATAIVVSVESQVAESWRQSTDIHAAVSNLTTRWLTENPPGPNQAALIAAGYRPAPLSL